ncbi:hypothetical protein PF008_g21593 [Phytophthora fragariae]|uniref:Uncharacterized protein n=1 Tax=Phytophthora fragariae TaxID=53985 RepID=A0A6G0QW69_9STRA|nr:hypothetical protein PF008_g21593 [Phytophthora fragariae]
MADKQMEVWSVFWEVITAEVTARMQVAVLSAVPPARSSSSLMGNAV